MTSLINVIIKQTFPAISNCECVPEFCEKKEEKRICKTSYMSDDKIQEAPTDCIYAYVYILES